MTDLGEMLRRASTPAFESIGALMRADETGTLEDEEFDRNLWLLVSRVVRVFDNYDEFPRPVVDYYASCRMEWDVGNGGFAQAAYNMPEWFEAAASG